MKNLNLTISELDLKTLYLCTGYCMGVSFNQWKKDTKEAYINFATNKQDVKTYSQWVNGQIIALT